jgi:peptidyl-prolyl cis-trans isomerase A (cyclophilin A)
MRTFLAATCALALVVVAVGGCGSSEKPAQQDAAPQTDGSAQQDAAPQTDGPAQEDATLANPVVVMVTTMGTIEVELFANDSPIGTANFLAYVDAQFYDATIIHRVIPGFVIQGGGLTADMTRKPTQAAIVNEAGNGLKNLRGTLSYARTSAIDSATSQFFVNLVDNAGLDHKDDTASGFGYAVFGRVGAGMDVVDAIAAVPTQTVGSYEDVPVTPVVVTSAQRKAQ